MQAASGGPVPPPPPAALVLVSAAYDAENQSATLEFDRAIVIGGFDGSQLILDDPETAGFRFDGLDGSHLSGPATVVIQLHPAEVAWGEAVVLNVTALSGIVAEDDGGTWAGVTDLSLPFP